MIGRRKRGRKCKEVRDERQKRKWRRKAEEEEKKSEGGGEETEDKTQKRWKMKHRGDEDKTQRRWKTKHRGGGRQNTEKAEAEEVEDK